MNNTSNLNWKFLLISVFTLNIEQKFFTTSMKVELLNVEFCIDDICSNPSEFTFAFVGNFAGNSLDDLIPLITTYIGSIPKKLGGEYDTSARKKRFEEAIENIRDEISFPEGIQGEVIYEGEENAGITSLHYSTNYSQKILSHN